MFSFPINHFTGKYQIRGMRDLSGQFFRSFFELTLIEAIFERVKGWPSGISLKVFFST